MANSGGASSAGGGGPGNCGGCGGGGGGGASAEPLFSQAQIDVAVETAIDRDRLENFMVFARALPPNTNGLIYGTGNQVRSIAKALASLGY